MTNTEKFAVALTAKDIEALQIALSAEKLNLESEVRHLEEHNKTGININKINQKRDRMKDCDRLFDILYNAMD